MRRYQRTLFNVCSRYLGNDRDADDVCQEVMLKVLYGLKNFEGKSKFKTWLYSITYNECITQYRKERRKRRLMDALSLDPLEPGLRRRTLAGFAGLAASHMLFQQDPVRKRHQFAIVRQHCRLDRADLLDLPFDLALVCFADFSGFCG